MLDNWICLRFSLFLCSRTMTLIIANSSLKIEEFFHKMEISLDNWSESPFFQWKMTWFSRHFFATTRALWCLAYSSLHVCLCVSPRHNSRRRSLFMLVLSHFDTHYLNRHMAQCGCHEIWIQHCIIVLSLSNFSLYLIWLWFWCLSY